MSASSFIKLIDQIMECSGITENDFVILLSNGHKILTDEIIFAISRYIDSIKGINIFFTRTIGTTEIRTRFFDIAIDYQFYNSDKKLSSAVMLNLSTLTLIVEFPLIEEKYTIGNDLLDFEQEKKNKLSILRMQVLNDLLTRYYSKILYAIYLQKRRR